MNLLSELQRLVRGLLRRRRIFTESTQIAFATLASGLFSYATFYVVAHEMPSDEASKFISWWALINTVALTATLPLDTYAPRLRLECEKEGILDATRRRIHVAYGAFLGILFLILLSSGVTLGITRLSALEMVGFASFGSSVALIGSQRSYLLAEERYGGYSIESWSACLSGLILLLILSRLDQLTVGSAFLAAAFGNVTGFLVCLRRKDFRIAQDDKSMLTWQSFVRLKTSATLGRLYASTLIALLMSNGSVIVAAHVGANSELIVEYAATVNLAMIPFTLLNTLTGPIHNRFANAIRNRQPIRLRSLYRTSLLLYLGVTISLSAIAFFLMPWIVAKYSGVTTIIEPWKSALIVGGEGIATSLALSRALAVVLGATRSFTSVWVVGLIAFVLVLSLPVRADEKLVAAPIAASLLMLLVAQARFGPLLVRLDVVGPSSV